MILLVAILSVTLLAQERFSVDQDGWGPYRPHTDTDLVTWTRIATCIPFVFFEGWYGDIAVAHLTEYSDLSGFQSEEILLISPDTSWTIDTDDWVAIMNQRLGMPEESFPENGICVSDYESIIDGTAAFILVIDVSDNDVSAMYQACYNFEDYLETGPPEVPINMSLIRVSDGRSVWNGSRDLTWFGGECAPIFNLPVLELAVVSPDRSHLFFSILYGPRLEHFVVELPPGLYHHHWVQ